MTYIIFTLLHNLLDFRQVNLFKRAKHWDSFFTHYKSTHANASYELEIAQDVDKTNPYAPFASQLDWDIAKWAKLRGPGSTAFGELMSIPGVCTLLSSVESGQVML